MNKKCPAFCAGIDTGGASLVLKLRDERPEKPASVLKPFSCRLFGAGQPSGPLQSRESRLSVKSDRLPLPFSSCLTPYSSQKIDRGRRTPLRPQKVFVLKTCWTLLGNPPKNQNFLKFFLGRGWTTGLPASFFPSVNAFMALSKSLSFFPTSSCRCL